VGAAVKLPRASSWARFPAGQYADIKMTPEQEIALFSVQVDLPRALLLARLAGGSAQEDYLKITAD